MFSNPLTLYGLIFIAALLLFDALLRLLFGAQRSKAEIRNRLESLKHKQGAADAYSNLLNRRGISGRIGGRSLLGRFNRFVAQTGLELSPARRIAFLLLFFFLGLVLAEILFSLNTVFLILSATAFSITLSLLLLSYFRTRRIRVFTSQLGPAIDIIVRSLNAGHPLVAAISLVAREMPDPVGSEFGILNDQMTFGAELEQAMFNMYQRVGAPELNLLTVTVSVQKGTGGNLSEILENLAQMIRDRQIVKAKIKAISSEGRATSWVMLVFPFALFAMIRLLVPTYFDMVWESGWGHYVVIGCLAMIFLGMLVIRRIVNFDF
ncbi:type II secretion system F family protein [Roseovarius autotrophicus]|uniref:type II secretion system F family protein n=1 Tax=Roseovarius autotrophicus TaxID=2824121 RepID=UPI001B3953F9|nr:type II secretion system F family protein [Roseovarius autotrophicus]